MASLEFAVIDVETTGLFPGGHDRVIEVAVLRLGSDGTPTQEFATLVNPGRDVGQHIFTASERATLRMRPSFKMSPVIF